jgi:hypothetical protein
VEEETKAREGQAQHKYLGCFRIGRGRGKEKEGCLLS